MGNPRGPFEREIDDHLLEGIGPTSLDLATIPAEPDAGSLPSDGVLLKWVHGVKARQENGRKEGASKKEPRKTNLRVEEACLSAEFTEILGMLADLHLLDLLPQTGTITGTWGGVHTFEGQDGPTEPLVNDADGRESNQEKRSFGTYHTCRRSQPSWFA